MNLGFHVASFSWEQEPARMGATLADVATAAEGVGASALSVMDHFFQLPGLGGPSEPMLEGYTTLGYVAGITSKIHLHLMVGGVTYRHPGLLPKTITTLDIVSGGRAGFGIGAAWHDREHVGLGVPFPSTSERFERLEETLQIAKQIWSDDDGPFDGKHYQLAETIDVPGPVQKPHPPIMVGGGGEKKTLRLVARYADACNLATGPGARTGPPEIAHKLRVLEGHCEAEGIDYDRIEKTIMYLGGPAATDEARAAFVEEMRAYADLGIDRVMVIPPGTDPAGYILRLASVITRLADL
ncbi:MAG: LLM class F420-dependent oxidoreductase [Acidimicrobiia bacterium]|nr:LLM class F420-dependent oxidoreductase [Acidimicrobiia bacterium]MDH3398509.1 LLM class F420-dependent oxidoreductase [Acidimicrobiia bacterium]MDH5615479.1 LLM class F420-dependent oxidoreductase [Acidimicrobiia bacterium]